MIVVDRIFSPRKTRAPRFLAAQDGLAALEFSMAFPVMLGVLFGFYEVDRYIETTRQLEIAAASVTQMLTQSVADKIGRSDVDLAYDAVKVMFPRVLQDSSRKGVDWRKAVSVSISSVAFTPTTPDCASNCAYTAKVAWSGGSVKRPCNVALKTAANNSAPALDALPADVFGPNGLVVVDLSYVYSPLFAAKLFSGFTIQRSSYMQPRYLPPAAHLKYSVAGGDALVTAC